MGSYEISLKSSNESIQDIVQVKTPSPLTSTDSSGKHKSVLSSSISSNIRSNFESHYLYNTADSLLSGLRVLITDDLTRRIRKQEDSKAEEKGEEISEEIDLTDKLKEKSIKNEVISLNTNSSSLGSSPSSLKQRLRDLPSISEVSKLADRAVYSDRRNRQERGVYLQIQGYADRIDEKDEAARSSVADTASIPSLLQDSTSDFTFNNYLAPISDMSSSAPETTRLVSETPTNKSLDVTTNLKKSRVNNFNERRPPKYLQPLEAPNREILRCNAPPLCITDKRISELLRRGTLSAREEYLKKSSKRPTKVSGGYRKPVGIIIKSLSSGSEEDNSKSEWIIRKPSESTVTKLEKKNSVPTTAINNELSVENGKDSGIHDNFRSSKREKSMQYSLRNSKEWVNDGSEVSDNPKCWGSIKSVQMSIDDSIAKLKNVLEDIDINSHGLRSVTIPKLEIYSQENLQASSLPSKEESTKRSLDVSALIRALKQQEIISLGDKRPVSLVRDNVISDTTGPKTSAHTSEENGSRQSMASLGNADIRNRFSVSASLSRASMDRTIKCNEKKSSENFKVPFVKESNAINSDIKVSRSKTSLDMPDFPQRDTSNLSSTNKTPVNQLINSTDSKDHFTTPYEINLPPMKKKQNDLSQNTSRTDESSRIKCFSQISKNNVQSLETVSSNCGKNSTKINDSTVTAFSEPGTSRIYRTLIQERLSSRTISGTPEALKNILKDEPQSSDDKFKYLHRGSEIPHVQSTSSNISSSSNNNDSRIPSNKEEETKFKTRIITPSATGFQSVDKLKSERKFKIYEEEASPRRDLTFSIDPSTPHFVNELSSSNDYSSEDLKNLSTNQPESTKNVEELAKSKNLFWADSMAELNQAMGSSFESPMEISNCSISSVPRFNPITPRSEVERNKKSDSSWGSSLKILSNTSLITTGSSSASSTYSDCNEKARFACKNLAAEYFDPAVSNDDNKKTEENLHHSSSIAKKLSHPKVKTSEFKSEITQSNVSLPNETIGNLSFESSTIAMNEKSTSTVHLLRKVQECSGTRIKISSSLSKLTHSPEQSRKEYAQRPCQDRSPFTITESTGIESTSKWKEKYDRDVRLNSGRETIMPSETAYGFCVHPSLLRSTSASVEPTAEEIIDFVSRDPDIRVKTQNFESSTMQSFSDKFSWRWLSERSKKRYHKSETGITEILYQNDEYRVKSVDESSGRTAVTLKRSERRDCDGVWVQELANENNSNVRDEGINKSRLTIKHVPDKEKKQRTMNRYSNFLMETESYPTQHCVRGYPSRIPINSMILGEDSEIDMDNGCVCFKFCQFLIGGSVPYRNRSTISLRHRRSRIKRRF